MNLGASGFCGHGTRRTNAGSLSEALTLKGALLLLESLWNARLISGILQNADLYQELFMFPQGFNKKEKQMLEWLVII